MKQAVSQLDDAPSASIYDEFLADLKRRIKAAQTWAALAVNAELVSLYWTIGRDILSRQRDHGWGAKVVERLAADLRRAFPGVDGLSSRNLLSMRSLAEAYPDQAFVKQAVAQIPWGHNIRLLQLVKDHARREWYIRQTIRHGWSRAVRVHQIETDLYGRQGKAVTNFDRTLPPADSDLVRQLLKDPYNFDFLTLGPDVQERELERGLLDHIRDFLLELGTGFAFVGSQYPLAVGGQDFYLDLLFYHVRLHRFVVVDLKVEEFKPEFAGKMNFYLSAVDDLVRDKRRDGASIGLLLCKTRDALIAEYALRDVSKPIGVAEYRAGQPLPPDVRDAMPTAEQLQAALDAGPAGRR